MATSHDPRGGRASISPGTGSTYLSPLSPLPTVTFRSVSEGESAFFRRFKVDMFILTCISGLTVRASESDDLKCRYQYLQLPIYDGGARVDNEAGNIIRPAPDLQRAVVVQDLESTQGNGDQETPAGWISRHVLACRVRWWCEPSRLWNLKARSTRSVVTYCNTDAIAVA